MQKWALVLLALVPLLAGCATQPSGEKEVKKVNVYGSGASFPAPQIYAWISEFEKQRKDITVEYTSKGSGAGINDFKLKLVHFACSDPPAKESEWREFEKLGKPLQFPFIVGAVAVVYNVPGVGELRLDGETLAKIFAGDIEFWDDNAIKALNPDARLPHEKIIVIHRSDSSGTTEIFTNYLSIVSEDFKQKVGAGKLVEWPVDKLGRGYGGKGNEGVSAMLKQTMYSIAYVELAYALHEKFPIVSLKNKAGKFVQPTDETISSAIVATKAFVPDPREGYKEDLKQFLNAPGENSYPIVAFSHVLLWESYEDKEVARAVKDFWKWVLTDGKKYMLKGYVALPDEIVKSALDAIEKIS
ncbi:MAG: phosphate ABC transporter substrate-binding protein PstS [Archaeoglobaceae archaeon]